VCRFSVDGEILFVNAAYASSIGMTTEAMIGRNFWDFIPESEHEHVLAMLGRLAPGAPEVRIENHFGIGEGARWMLWTNRALTFDAEGRVVEAQSTGVDITERKRAEHALHELQARQRFLLELADAMRPLHDPLDIQEAAARLLGRYLGVSRAFYGETHGDDVRISRCFAEGVAPILGRLPALDYSARMIEEFRSGRIHGSMDTQTDPAFDEIEREALRRLGIGAYLRVPLVKDGRWIATLGVHASRPRAWTNQEQALLEDVAQRTWDAVERAHSQVALRESEKKYRLLFESIDEGFCIVEIIVGSDGSPVDYLILETNRAFEIHTGLHGAVGKRAREIIPGLEDRWVQMYGKVGLTGEPLRFSQDAAGLDGRWFDVYAFRVGRPEALRVGILFSDVTQRRRLDQALTESEARFRELADTAPAMVWVTEPDGHCSFLSRGWYEYTGQSEETALGLGWLDAVHPDDREAARTAFLDATVRREPLELDHRVRHASGDYRWVVDAGRPRWKAGVFAGFVGSVIDVHSRKLAEHALREADVRKDEFLAMLAHELRNPLAPLRNALRVLEHEPLGERGQLAIGMGQRQVRHLNRLVDDLLEVSRVTRGLIELRPEPVLVQHVVYATMDALASTFEERNQHVSIKMPERPVKLHADPVRLAQIVENLLTNASKYTDPGGLIAVHVTTASDTITLTVHDTGIGIAPDHLPGIFELFTQVDTAIDRSRGGLGIGLALVKRLVVQHGGTVDCTSQGLGKGSTFTVCLPRGVIDA
jgi:PAS domain S-box-containing protein